MTKLNLTNSGKAMQQAIILLAIPLLLSGIFSCSDESGNSSIRQGSLMVSLHADTTFRQILSTKAVMDEFQPFVDPTSYAVEIQQEEQVIRTFSSYQEMPETVTLESGAYRLMAYKGENVAGGLASPYFEGAMDFSIESQMLTPLELTCRLANTRVTVDYEEDFRKVYHSYAVHFNTPYMTDTLVVGEEEERAAYFRSDSKGTDLEIVLELKRFDDETAYYYKPGPIAIEPRQNVNLRFKTDGEAISGIGLTVTLNDELDDNVILDMEIPGYAFDEVDKPTWGKDKFELELSDITYRTLQKQDEHYYLDFIVPAAVGQAVVQISRKENESVTTEEFNLAHPEEAAVARQLGIVLTDQANDQTYDTALGIRNGRIHFTEALALLPPSKSEVEYTYSLYIIDALPIDPHTSDTVALTVKPKAVGVSRMTGTQQQEYTVMAQKSLTQDIEIAFDTDAGIETATLNVYRNEILADRYALLSDELPEGIAFADDKLTFDSSFTQALAVDAFGRDEKYTFTIEATDQVDEPFEGSPISFSVVLNPFVEITIPTPEIWGWKANVAVAVDGLTEGNKNALTLALSEDSVAFTPLTNYTVEEEQAYATFHDLTPGTTYYVRASLGNTEVNQSFTTENNLQPVNGDMNTWYMSSTKCTYKLFSFTVNKFIPFPVLNSTATEMYWKTNNHVTAGESFHDDNAANHPKGCFPTVVYEGRDEANQFAAVIRSIDASAFKNGKARGELVYENKHTSRPSGISFDYTYAPNGEESFVAEVAIYAGETIIGTGSRPVSAGIASEYSACTIPIVYTENMLKATAIRIFFASSDKESDFGITSGQAIRLPQATVTPVIATYPINKYDTHQNVSAGSTLRIDNVSLNYTAQ